MRSEEEIRRKILWMLVHGDESTYAFIQGLYWALGEIELG
jgi:hypothetical protein